MSHIDAVIFNSLNYYSVCCGLYHEYYYHPFVCTANCGYPASDSIDEALRVIGYEAPMLEGSSIILDCFPGYALIGSNSATCMENGEWEPDPRDVECEGIVREYFGKHFS